MLKGRGDSMDWIAIGTLAAAVVAAIAAAWAAVVSHRQMKLTERAADFELPIVEATVMRVDEQPDWTQISLEMRNRAPVALDLLTVTLVAPANVGLLSDSEATDQPGEVWEAHELLNPLPADRAKTTVAQTGHMNRAGAVGRHLAGDTELVTLYAHCPLPRMFEERNPRLSLEMRWRDHTTKTFAMAVNVIKPSTT